MSKVADKPAKAVSVSVDWDVEDFDKRADQLVKDVDELVIKMQRDMEYLHGLRMCEHLINSAHERGEALICAIFDYFCKFRRDQLLGIDGGGILKVEREVTVSCGRADRVITHRDGSITAVEIKAAGDLRSKAGGLGQVLMYAEALRKEHHGKEVRAALVVGGDAPGNECLVNACLRADVAFLPITSGYVDKFMSEAKLTWDCFSEIAKNGKQEA